MTADLRTVPDHPAKILLKIGDSFGHEVLRQFETINHVTFTALDNQSLTEVQDAYLAWTDADNQQQMIHCLGILARAVGDLLGLND
jgi:hypothetical protein